jgi:hypothetical protein
MNRILVGCIVGVVVLPNTQTSSARRLATLIPGLYGGDGIILATDPTANHAAHFTVDSSASINRLNEQITSQIGIFPFSSSVSGFTFAFDPSLGTFLRTTERGGPTALEPFPLPADSGPGPCPTPRPARRGRPGVPRARPGGLGGALQAPRQCARAALAAAPGAHRCSHLVRQGVLEGVLALWEETRFVQELGGLEVRQVAMECCLG